MEMIKKVHKKPLFLDPNASQELLVLVAGWLIGKSENTKKAYTTILQEFWAEFSGAYVLEDIQTFHVTYFLKKIEKRRGAGSFNLYRACLSSFFSFAVKSGKMTKNPAALIKKIPTTRFLHLKTVSPFQVSQMLIKAKSTRDKVILRMLYYLGLRASELCAIKMEDFQKRADGIFLNVIGKGKKLRTIPIDQDLFLEIEMLADTNPTRGGYLFQRKLSSLPMDRKSLWFVIKKLAKLANIEPLPHPHTFRHTCATLAIEGGAPIHTVQHRLGHASIATTQIYLHPSPEETLSKYIQKLEE
jgi:integrase/recombinase XerD